MTCQARWMSAGLGVNVRNGSDNSRGSAGILESGARAFACRARQGFRRGDNLVGARRLGQSEGPVPCWGAHPHDAPTQCRARGRPGGAPRPRAGPHRRHGALVARSPIVTRRPAADGVVVTFAGTAPITVRSRRRARARTRSPTSHRPSSPGSPPSSPTPPGPCRELLSLRVRAGRPAVRPSRRARPVRDPRRRPQLGGRRAATGASTGRSAWCRPGRRS